AQRRLRELRGRREEVHHLDDRLLRIDHAEVHHRVHLDRHVVARDHVLRWHVEHDRAQVHLHHLLDHRHQEEETGPLHRPEASQLEDHPALVLAQHAHRQEDEDERDDDRAGAEVDDHWLPPISPCTTSSVRPSIPTTFTCSPFFIGCALRTRHVSPWRCAQPSPSKSERTRPVAPKSSSRPLTTGRRRAFRRTPITSSRKAALAAANPPINAYGTR